LELVLTDRSVDLDTGRISTGGELRPMELRILRYLARKGGAVVSPRELLSEVWGYAPALRTATVHSTIYRLRAAIEADPKNPRHLVTVSRSGVQLVGLQPAPTSLTNLRAPRDRLFGRSRELAELGVGGSRLVTLVGPSGVGKTRLAIEWAMGSAEVFPDGRWFVEATGVASAADLTDRVARVLRVVPETVSQALAPRGLLLVLDDLLFERAELAHLLGQWLDHGGATLLVTAHDRLALQGERVVVLGPLALDPTSLQAPATAMLIDRIGLGHSSFRPEDHARELIDLAAAVDGIPLALEIAAAHGATLGPALTLEVFRRRSLSASRPGSHDRHRSIEAMLECTWDRLPAWSQLALRQLAVFHRSFTLDAALAVLELPPQAPPPDGVISALVGRGLLTSVSDAPHRFRLFDTVRSFVRRRAIDPLALERLVAWYELRSRPMLHDGLPDDVQPSDPAEIDEWDHIARVVLDERTPGDRVTIVVAAYVAAMGAGRFTLAEALAERVEDLPMPEVCRAWFSVTRARWWVQRRRQAASVAYAERVMRGLPGEVPVMSAAYAFMLATAYMNLGDPDAARAAYTFGHEARARSQIPRRASLQLELHQLIAESALYMGEVAATRAARRAVQRVHELGEPAGSLLVNLVISLLEREQVEEAEAVLRRANTEVSTPHGRAQVLAHRARVLVSRGQNAEALELIQYAQSELNDPNEPNGAWLRLSHAYIQIAAGDFDGAEVSAEMLALHPVYASPRLRMAVDTLRGAILASRGSIAAVSQLEGVIQEALAARYPRAADIAGESLSAFHAGRGAWSEALAVLQRLEGTSRRPWLVRARIEALRALGRPQEALQLIERAGAEQEPFPWLPYAEAALRTELGQQVAAPGAPLDSYPWTRLYLARIAAARGEITQARVLLVELGHPLDFLLPAAVAELRARLG
jgi:tetratricopeptide (TPR) repeat protein